LAATAHTPTTAPTVMAAPSTRPSNFVVMPSSFVPITRLSIRVVDRFIWLVDLSTMTWKSAPRPDGGANLRRRARHRAHLLATHSRGAHRHHPTWHFLWK
jgi:hypothetical protein